MVKLQPWFSNIYFIIFECTIVLKAYNSYRKNRNMYSKLLLRMLKRGNIDGPFATRPDTGPLKSLPSYMVSTSIFDKFLIYETACRGVF